MDQALGRLPLLARARRGHPPRVPARAASRGMDRGLLASPRAPRGRHHRAPAAARGAGAAARGGGRGVRGADPLSRSAPLRAPRLLGERDVRLAQRGLSRLRHCGSADHRGGSVVRGGGPAATLAQPRPPCLFHLRRAQRRPASPPHPAHRGSGGLGGPHRAGHDAGVPRAGRPHVARGRRRDQRRWPWSRSSSCGSRG